MERQPPSIPQPSPPDASQRLDSWKEIAAYLKRDVTTVQRWEKREGLPVHRHQHDRQGTVFAYEAELERWLRQRLQPSPAEPSPGGQEPARIDGFRRLKVASRPWLGLAIAVALLLTTVAAVISFSRQVERGTLDAPLPRFALHPPPLQTFNHLAISADGQALLYSAGPTLHVRQLDQLNARSLPDTQGAYDPFWAPDREWFAFFSGRELKKMRVSGGRSQALAPASRSVGGTWGTRGDILFAADRGSVLYRVRDSGGDPVPIRRVSDRAGWRAIRWPHFLPDGRRFLYFVRSDDPAVQGIYLGDLSRSGARADERVADAESNVFYSAGHLAFVRRGILFAQPFDVARARTTGGAFPITERIDQDPYDDGFALFSLSMNGVLAYRGGQTLDRQLRWFDREGRQRGALDGPGEYRDLMLSRDGTKLAFERMDPNTGMRDIWVRELDRDGILRLTSGPDEDGAPVWSPDASQMVFAGIRDRQVTVLRESAAGGAERRLLRAIAVPLDWSPDGKSVVLELMTPTNGTDLVLLDPESGELTTYLATPFMEREAQFSPDGRYMAYSSSESGQRETYIEPIPRDGRRWRVSTDYGREPRWHGEGRELFYLGRNDTITAVPVEYADGSLTLGRPEPLFQVRIRGSDVRYHYAVRPDGQQFLVNTVVEDVPGTPINVWVDWLSEARGSQ